jgi:hypothetical protein
MLKIGSKQKVRESSDSMSDSTNGEPRTVPAKYVFLDVVDFSRERSVESQSYIVESLNRIVRLALSKNQISNDDLLLLPTGDGICIALLNIMEPYDIHLQLALSILEYNDKFTGHDLDSIDESAADGPDVELVLISEEPEYLRKVEMRNYRIRIGIESNIDNLVTDINGRENIAGAGINSAQRVMGLADGGQIIVGQSVYNELRYREKYMNSFRTLPSTKVKHNISVQTYQFIGKDHRGLNTEHPEGLKPKQHEVPKLSKLAAYYFAHAVKNRNFLLENYTGSGSYSEELLIWLLAEASIKMSEAKTDAEKLHYERYYRIKETLEELKSKIDSSLFKILEAAREYVKLKGLASYTQYFEDYDEYRFVNQEGLKKLKNEWPDVWEEFQIGELLKASEP